MCFAVLTTSKAEDKTPAQKAADHLQNVSVTIRSEGDFNAGEGSGVIFSRKDSKGNLVNFVWTAAHVVDNLRSERKVLVDGSPKTLVEFKDPMIVKEIRQNGRTVGRLQMDAEVLKYSDASDGHDLALLRVRKFNFVTDTVVFHLDKEIPALGTDLMHVGSLLGQMGANSMTDGIYSQHGRLIRSLNKHVFDQTTVTAFPGSSGGGVYLKSDAKYIGRPTKSNGRLIQRSKCPLKRKSKKSPSNTPQKKREKIVKKRKRLRKSTHLKLEKLNSIMMVVQTF
jgi:hypothetical protein